MVGCAVLRVYARALAPGDDLFHHQQQIHDSHDAYTHAFTNPRRSLTRWVRFIRAVSRLPSASLICTRVVGSEVSTSNCVLAVSRGALPLDAAGLAGAGAGKSPGMADTGTGAAEGTGEPKRCPDPAKARRDAEPAGGT